MVPGTNKIEVGRPMTEVDFLPQWYRESRRRQSSVQRQYVVLGAIFLIMIVWNAMATRSISLATADLAEAEPKQIEADRLCYQYDCLVRALTHHREALDLMQDLEGRLDLASVLAELSALIDGPVAMESLEVITERASGPSPSGAASAAEPANAGTPLGGTVRFQVVMKGLAQDAPAVAATLKAMEASAYFRQVTLVISRPLQSVEDRTDASGSRPTAGPGLRFEIRCHLATDLPDAGGSQ